MTRSYTNPIMNVLVHYYYTLGMLNGYNKIKSIDLLNSFIVLYKFIHLIVYFDDEFSPYANISNMYVCE